MTGFGLPASGFRPEGVEQSLKATHQLAVPGREFGVVLRTQHAKRVRQPQKRPCS
jgi:hypothetical protein